ncbi:MAG: Bro-N domain-containing protein [Candidatus Aenigmarchaeota archaeon]|nr:Bro-N domain-containing protein [Candidatus Aenigmarchaeota archaeon]
MGSKDALVVFQDKRIRRVWYNDRWYFSIIDVVCALEASSIPKRYWSDLKSKLSDEGFEPYDKIVQLKLQAEDGKLRFTDCANTKDMFRIIQSIPSKKAEPFKRWLAQVGYERIEEIENPELGQDRIKRYYELKGYPKDWIDKRLRGIAIRQELTEEWKNRDIQEQKDFAILTNEITKATFGKTIKEYKDFKKLEKVNQNLRDHMTDWELILTMVGEKATTDITISKDSKGFGKCKDSAIEGGTIAKNTRKELEQKIGKPLVSDDNYLGLAEKKIEDKKKSLYESG